MNGDRAAHEWARSLLGGNCRIRLWSTALSLRTTLSWHADSTSSSSRLASLMNLLSFRAGLEREATIEVPMETCSGLAIGRLVVGDLIEAHLLRQAAASRNISRSQLWETT